MNLLARTALKTLQQIAEDIRAIKELLERER